MALYYSDIFVLPLPAHHRFPMGKYARLRDRLLASGDFEATDFIVPPGVTDAEIDRVHCPRYRERVVRGELDAREQRAIGFPWSEAMVERSRRSSGATLAAAREALARGWSANLAGGTHHAFRDRGEGFCVFNDAAIAARALQAEAGLRRIAIVDCDVHQGNGSAAIFSRDESVFTFSIHGARNYPFAKEASDLDTELADGTGDDVYLAALAAALPRVLATSAPDLVVYIAGADPHEGDRLGRLALTFDGLARRDAIVLDLCREVGIPVAITIGGGYGRRIEDTVAAHLRTVRVARAHASG